jgi:hypothetical protein
MAICPQPFCQEGLCGVQFEPCPPPSCEDLCNVVACQVCWDGSSVCSVGQCIEEVCTLVGDACPPEPGCDPAQAKGQGACAEVLGFVWDGDDCTGIAGCSCVGANCNQVFPTHDQCMGVHAACVSPPSPCSGKPCGELCDQCDDFGCVIGFCDADGVCAGPPTCP